MKLPPAKSARISIPDSIGARQSLHPSCVRIHTPCCLFHELFDNISTGMLDGIHVDTQDGYKNLMQEPEREAYRVIKTNLNAQGYPILKEMIAQRPFTPGSHINVL
jgi:hypothetical protein